MLPEGVTMTWLMDDEIEPEAGLSLARMTIGPGVISEPHRHTNCTEAIHVISGAVRQRSAECWVTLEQGQTILIPVGAVHQTHNVSKEKATLMIAYSSGSRVYEPT